MNHRIAKKRVKAKHHLKKYPGNLPPRFVDILFTEFKKRLKEEITNTILYGSAVTDKEVPSNE